MSAQRITAEWMLAELSKERDLAWELEMLSCFPEDSDCVGEEEWALLLETIQRHETNLDMEIQSRVENLKLAYNVQARKQGDREEILLNLSVKPWMRVLGSKDGQEFAARVVQEIKYEDVVKLARESPQRPRGNALFRGKTSHNNKKQGDGEEGGKRSRQMDQVD